MIYEMAFAWQAAQRGIYPVRTRQYPEKGTEFGLTNQVLARGGYLSVPARRFFVTASISGPPAQIAVRAGLSYSFPLNMAEVVCENGSATFRQAFLPDTTPEFGEASFEWRVEAKKLEMGSSGGLGRGSERGLLFAGRLCMQTTRTLCLSN